MPSLMPDSLVWEVHVPGEKALVPAGNPVEPWKAELSDFRGRMLLEYTGHPHFQIGPNQYWDWEEVDEWASHIVGRIDGQIAGCVRVLAPLGEFPSAFFFTSFPPGVAAQALKEIGMDLGKVAEAGRWFTEPRWRHHTLGSRLLSASGTLAMELNYEFLVGLLGTRTSQDKTLIKYGAKPFPNLPPIFSTFINDTLHPLFINLKENNFTHKSAEETKGRKIEDHSRAI